MPDKTTAAEMYADARLEKSFYRHVLTTAQLALIRQELKHAFEAGVVQERKQQALNRL